MKIYKVSNNWRKSISTVEIESINDNLTFNYFMDRGPLYQRKRLRTLSFLPENPNSPAYFIDYKDAKQYLSERLKENISFYEKQINDANAVLNNL